MMNPTALACTEDYQDQLHDMVASQRYGVEYQPIICTRSGDILAYEALARFYDASGTALAPPAVFDSLHREPTLLQQVELDLKTLQIDYAPADYELFVNVDPHAIERGPGAADHPLFTQLARRDSVVVELIENSDIHEARAAAALHGLLKQQGIRTALDDIGASHALISLDVLSLVDYLKFDRSWSAKLQDGTYTWLFRTLLDFSRQTGKTTVLEGIEDEDTLATACRYGIDRVQGFLYRRLFRSRRP